MSPEMDIFLVEHAAGGREPAQTIEVAIVDPPKDVSRRLNLQDGEPAVVRRRVRYLDGEPFNTNDSYFPLSLVQNTEIMRPDDIARGANQVLAISKRGLWTSFTCECLRLTRWAPKHRSRHTGRLSHCYRPHRGRPASPGGAQCLARRPPYHRV